MFVLNHKTEANLLENISSAAIGPQMDRFPFAPSEGLFYPAIEASPPCQRSLRLSSKATVLVKLLIVLV